MVINLLLIDNQSIVEDGLRRILEIASPKYQLHYAPNEAKAFEILKKVPDMRLVCCETTLNGEDSGPSVGREIQKFYPNLRIIGISPVDYCRAGVPNREIWSREGFEYINKIDMGPDYFKKLLVKLEDK